jgi:hypothetical protein
MADTNGEIYAAVETGWIKMIAASSGQFDAEWNAYVANLKKAGLDKFIEAYQEYYDTKMKM